jgi:AcrR family transcriptional regulator
MPAENRRRQIVAIAAELFSKKGFSGTTTKEIADQAGVSEAIIFRHFPSKEVLYAAILDYKTRETAQHLRSHLREAANRKDDVAFFGSLAYSALELHRKDPTLMRLLLYSALEGHELSEIFFASTAQETRSFVRRYIKQRAADGAFREIDPNVAARAFVGAVIFHAQTRALFKTDDVRISSRQIADRFVDLFLAGALREPMPRERTPLPPDRPAATKTRSLRARPTATKTRPSPAKPVTTKTRPSRTRSRANKPRAAGVKQIAGKARLSAGKSATHTNRLVRGKQTAPGGAVSRRKQQNKRGSS